MVCHGKGQASILGPADELPQDENKTKRAHTVVGYSHVILVRKYGVVLQFMLKDFHPATSSIES